ncbi:MAG: hypothetical protein ABIJ43_04850 [Candidatus Beckwithbacteria bacterium]
MSKIKSKIIKRLSRLRKVYSNIYIFILSGYLGKTIITLNTIDHIILNWIFYFLVYSPTENKQVKEFYRIVSSKPMGVKLKWLEDIYNGKVPSRKSRGKLKLSPTVTLLIKHPIIKKIITLSKKLVQDTRNPLVHSHYTLGFGNEDHWNLHYNRTYFSKKANKLERSKFEIKDAKEYLNEVEKGQKILQELFFKTLNSVYPIKKTIA